MYSFFTVSVVREGLNAVGDQVSSCHSNQLNAVSILWSEALHV